MRRRIPVAAWFAISFFGAIGFGLGTVAWVEHRARADFEAAKVEASALGLPVTPADMRSSAPERGQNAALAYAAILAADLPPREPSPYGNTSPTEFAAGMTAWLAKHEEQLAQANYLPYFQPERPWELGHKVLYADSVNLKRVVKSLSLSAEYAAQNRNPSRALRQLQLAKGVAEHMGQETTLISYLIAIACEDVVLLSGARCAYWSQSDSKAMADFEAFLDEPMYVPGYKHALRGEVYYATGIPGSLADNSGPWMSPGQDWTMRISLRLPWARYGAAAAYLRRLTNLYSDLPDEPDLQKQMDVARQADSPKGRPGGPTGMLYNMVSTPHAAAAAAAKRLEIRTCMMRIAARLLALKGQKGSYPSRLPRWEAINTDQFSYMATSDGFVLKSLDPDKSVSSVIEVTADGVKLRRG